jgi:hypothetical protein
LRRFGRRFRFADARSNCIDVFNVLNLLNRDWGRLREAAPGLLEQVGQIVGSAPGPVFRCNTTVPGLTTASPESSFQLQLAVRYRF